MFLIFDTETTGTAKNFKAPVSDGENWPRLVQIAWQLHDERGRLIESDNLIVRPDGFTIPFNVVKIHGITTERATEEGQPLAEVVEKFEAVRARAKYIVGHNIEFDAMVVGAECHRLGIPHEVVSMPRLDTKDLSTDFCAIPGGKGGGFKWPRLEELYQKLFGEPMVDAHDAAFDVDATARCFFSLVEKRVFDVPEIPDPTAVEYEAPKLGKSNFHREIDLGLETVTDVEESEKADISDVADLPFAHLHCHTQFSVLQSTTSVEDLVNKAVEMNMPAVAMSDHGNMMGVFRFVQAALKADITPIVGCEFNLAKDRNDRSHQDNGSQTVLLAKNKTGYHNLAKLSSLAFTEGFYYVPRIDKRDLEAHREGLIATTGGIWGEVPDLILNVGETQAEEAFVWWKETFGDDFYVELNRHGIEEEDVVNETLLRFAKKYGVKCFPANNTYYTEKADAAIHDILLCIRDSESVDKPKKYIGRRGREYRFGFPNEEFYFKSSDEMKKLFADMPEALETVGEILGKIERYELAREVLLPKFDIPTEFIDPLDANDGGNRGENAYLRHLTYEGAKERWGEVTPEIAERLDFELQTIANTGYPGYFLIVQDFCREARNRGVSIGPGRGSAAGSAVAYCIGITNVDPIKYDLLFERFLNPDRVSMPDIDIDFDDEGRQKVLQYVIDKYGANQVAQIITYGTMAAKSSVRDAGRVMGLPLHETDRLAKMIPDTSLAKLFKMSDKDISEKFRDNQVPAIRELIAIAKEDSPQAQVIKTARAIEGSVRNTGIHACGVIITPGDITDFVPVATAKDSDMWCTQYDNSVVESAGLLKMDFLGLKTLTLIKDAIAIVKERYGQDIDPDEIPLDDEKTYHLFQQGDTVGIFQYESAGMQAYLKELRPTVFDDLIAMNALFRPGPMEYIPQFIRRKHGLEEISYDLEASREYLEETYGITVYQEQVMLLSQKLAGFTKGEADLLRKAMGKKIFKLLDELKPKFLEGCRANGHDEKIAAKIWHDWEAFASYAFNKSHSTCYALVAYQTAYLKAHFPSAYMASVLSNNMGDIKKVTFFMDECRRMGTPVLGPDVNESNLKFTVNNDDEIRFGMAAIKGVGEAAVQSIIDEREANGPFLDIYDFVSRTDKRMVNRRCIENLALAGALDCFKDIRRSQYFGESLDGPGTFADHLVKFGEAMRNKAAAPPDLFGGIVEVEVKKPLPPDTPPWGNIDKLNKEKEVVGVYISAHPLDDFRFEIRHFAQGDLRLLSDLKRIANRELALAGMVAKVEHRTTKNGKPYGVFEFEDFYENHRFFIFSEDYMRMRPFLIPGAFLLVRGKAVEKQWSQTKELEFKISSMELLSDLREKYKGKVIFEVPLSEIDEQLIEQLDKLTTRGPKVRGVPLEFRVVDPLNEISLRMPSRSVKIDLTDENIRHLNTLKRVSYSLNS